MPPVALHPPATATATATVPRVAYLYAGAVVLLWVGFSLAGRYAALAAGPRLTPWDLMALRYASAMPVGLVAYAAGPGRGLGWRRGLALVVLAGLCFPAAAFTGFTYAPAAHGAVILSGTLPFFVALGLSMTGDERWTVARLQSLAVLLGGMALLGYAAFAQHARPGAWRGDLLFLVAVITWAAVTVLIRRWRVRPWQVVSTVSVGSGLLYLPVWALALPSHLAAVPVRVSLAQSVMQGLLTTVLSVLLYTRALQLMGANRVALLAALVPGLAGLLSLPLLGEALDIVELAGLALVGVAVALGVRTPRAQSL